MDQCRYAKIALRQTFDNDTITQFIILAYTGSLRDKSFRYSSRFYFSTRPDGPFVINRAAKIVLLSLIKVKNVLPTFFFLQSV